MSSISDLDDFRALEPFFRIIEDALGGLADGEHFFDLLAEDVVFDYVITVPNYPRHVVGRNAVAELYRPYGEVFVLDRCFDLAVHRDRETGKAPVRNVAAAGARSVGCRPASGGVSCRFLACWRVVPSLGRGGVSVPRL
jgi:hypothetical protein